MVKEKLTSGLAAQGRLAQLIKFGSPATDCWPKFNHKSDRRLLFHRLSTDAKTSWPLHPYWTAWTNWLKVNLDRFIIHSASTGPLPIRNRIFEMFFSWHQAVSGKLTLE